MRRGIEKIHGYCFLQIGLGSGKLPPSVKKFPHFIRGCPHCSNRTVPALQGAPAGGPVSPVYRTPLQAIHRHVHRLNPRNRRFPAQQRPPSFSRRPQQFTAFPKDRRILGSTDIHSVGGRKAFFCRRFSCNNWKDWPLPEIHCIYRMRLFRRERLAIVPLCINRNPQKKAIEITGHQGRCFPQYFLGVRVVLLFKEHRPQFIPGRRILRGH